MTPSTSAHARLAGACLTILVALILPSLTGCRQSSVSGESNDTIVFTGDSEDLTELSKSRQQAIENLQQFIDALQQPQPGQEKFAVKSRFTNEKPGAVETPMTQVEYMWVMVTAFENDTFRGTLNNTPRVLSKSMQEGEEVSVAKDAIYDWIYMDNGKQQGGFSIEFLRNKVKEPDEGDEGSQ